MAFLQKEGTQKQHTATAQLISSQYKHVTLKMLGRGKPRPNKMITDPVGTSEHVSICMQSTCTQPSHWRIIGLRHTAAPDRDETQQEDERIYTSASITHRWDARLEGCSRPASGEATEDTACFQPPAAKMKERALQLSTGEGACTLSRFCIFVAAACVLACHQRDAMTSFAATAAAVAIHYRY